MSNTLNLTTDEEHTHHAIFFKSCQTIWHEIGNRPHQKALDTSFEVQCHAAAPVAQEDTIQITTIAASAEKAKVSPLGNHFITTVRPEKPEREQKLRYVLLYPCALQK